MVEENADFNPTAVLIRKLNIDPLHELISVN